MRRIRSIKPEILEDEVVACLPHLQWRLFVSLWLLADDYGNLRGRAAMIRGAALWACEEGDPQVQQALDALAALGLLRPYTVRGQTYLHIEGWERHQRVDKPGKPAVPGPLEDSREPRENSRGVREDVENHREPVATDRDLDLDLDQEREGSASASRAPSRPRPADPTLAARRTAGDQIWQEHQETRQAVAAELGLENLPLPLQDGGRLELANRLRDAHDAGEALALAAARCRHVLARVAADCRRDRTMRWLDGQLWRKDRFDVSAAQPLGDGGPQARAGPRRGRDSPADDDRNRIRKIRDL
jgi:hypothetical protein